MAGGVMTGAFTATEAAFPADEPTAEPVFVRRIRLRARRRVLWLRSLWTADAAGGLGAAITHAEVDRILIDAAEGASAEEAFYATDPAARALGSAIAGADIATATDDFLHRFRHDFALDDAELDLLMLAAAVEADPWLRRVYGYLHDDPTACLPTPWLETLTGFVRALSREGGPALELVLAASTGAGKRTLAIQLCDELGIPLVIADARQLMGAAIDAAGAVDAMVLVARTARMVRAAVYWHEADTAQPAALRELGRRAPLSLFGTSAGALAPSDDGDVARRTVRLPPLTRSARALLWAQLSETDVPAPVLDWPLLPSDIVRAAATAPAGPAAVVEACRATLRVESTTLATCLPRPYAWDDLVLAPPVRRHLDELEAQARLRWPVYEDWGFGRLCPMGRGIAALFAGPSGTGKTMAAQVLARSLGMEIYRVDLAGVMSKYIGETEKNLRQVFDACERANVLLFFDEADALFGQRTQVKDAHDRFANIEIDYLLQRMEQFDGLAVLATNRRGDIDPAFLRRVRFIIDFQPPGAAERRRMWTLALPARAPDGSELLGAIDWDALAQRLDLTGADIKAAAMGAAFLARSEGTRIGMSHLLHAARRELAKRGIVIRTGELEGLA